MDKKSILIGALGASLLFVSIGAGTQQEQATHTTVPESHVWELKMMDVGEKHYRYMYNKVTGEVREITRIKGYTKLPLQSQ